MGQPSDVLASIPVNSSWMEGKDRRGREGEKQREEEGRREGGGSEEGEKGGGEHMTR